MTKHDKPISIDVPEWIARFRHTLEHDDDQMVLVDREDVAEASGAIDDRAAGTLLTGLDAQGRVVVYFGKLLLGIALTVEEAEQLARNIAGAAARAREAAAGGAVDLGSRG